MRDKREKKPQQEKEKNKTRVFLSGYKPHKTFKFGALWSHFRMFPSIQKNPPDISRETRFGHGFRLPHQSEFFSFSNGLTRRENNKQDNRKGRRDFVGHVADNNKNTKQKAKDNDLLNCIRYPPSRLSTCVTVVIPTFLSFLFAFPSRVCPLLRAARLSGNGQLPAGYAKKKKQTKRKLWISPSSLKSPEIH